MAPYPIYRNFSVLLGDVTNSEKSLFLGGGLEAFRPKVTNVSLLCKTQFFLMAFTKPQQFVAESSKLPPELRDFALTLLNID